MILFFADNQARFDRTHKLPNLPHGRQNRPWNTATESLGARRSGQGRTFSNQRRERNRLDDFGRIAGPLAGSLPSCEILTMSALEHHANENRERKGLRCAGVRGMAKIC